MATCPCCGDLVPASAEPGELCLDCQSALEFSTETASAPASPQQETLTEAAEEAARNSGQPRAKQVQPYPITQALIGINIVLYGLMAIAHSIWPKVGALQWGADWGPLSLSGQWWRLLTATFMHASVGHLLGNMFFLWFFGKRLEKILGNWTFLLFYLSCGLAGSVAALAFNPNGIHCGASGAVFGVTGGLAGAYGIKGLALSRRARWKLVLLIAWIAFSVYPDPEVDNVAHATGLLTGLALGAFLASRIATVQRRRWVFSGVAGILVLSAASVRFYHRDVAALGPAASYLESGDKDAALKELNVVLGREPDNIMANTLAGGIYLEKEDNANAEAAARHVLRRNPHDDAAKAILGIAELRTGRCHEAYALLWEAAKEHQPHIAFTFGITGCNHVAEGDRYLSEGNSDLAIQAYKSAIEGHGDPYLAQVGLAKAYELAGKREEAQEAAAQAAKLQPTRKQ